LSLRETAKFLCLPRRSGQSCPLLSAFEPNLKGITGMRTLNLRRAALGSASFIGLAMAFANPALAQGSVTADAAQPNCDPNDPNDPDCAPPAADPAAPEGTM